jgi:D-sedoheptulose 7-phosphate isomerase
MNYLSVIEDMEKAAKEFFNTKAEWFREAIDIQLQALRRGGKILIFGNGGSASQSQHYAAELINAFLERERPSIPAIALTTDTSALTSIANDRGYTEVFARQVEGLGQQGDAAVTLSTSGNSPSIAKAVKTCKAMGITTIALTGEGGGRLAESADLLLDVPSRSTPRIQEVHLLFIHLMAEALEKTFI